MLVEYLDKSRHVRPLYVWRQGDVHVDLCHSGLCAGPRTVARRTKRNGISNALDSHLVNGNVAAVAGGLDIWKSCHDMVGNG
jgi:hypothetical protein